MTYQFIVVFCSVVVVAAAQSCVPSPVHGYCSSSTCSPDDFDTTCRGSAFDSARAHFGPDWVIMFDTFDYFSLINADNSATLVPRQFDGDSSTAAQWARGRQSLCQNQLTTCSFAEGPQDNWIFSRHIKYPPSSTTAGGGYQTEVYVNFEFRFSRCTSNSACSNDFVTLYRQDRDTVDSQRTSQANYQPMFGPGTETTDSRFQQTGSTDVTLLRSFVTPGNTGFHLGVRDEGTCGDVARITIYYTPCPELQDGLVYYPELVRPPENSGPHIGQACCVDNAHPTTSLSFRTFPASDGRCERSVRCDCDPGYSLRSTGLTCETCPAGTYRSDGDPHETCLSCPENTLTDAVGAPECECMPTYFRTMTEDSGVGCTGPPSEPIGLGCSASNGSSVSLTWAAPASDGGRSDVFYVIEYQNITSSEGFMERGSVSDLTFTLTGLEPTTQYRIKVYAENGVSDQDMRPGIRETRSSEVLCMTGEGLPEAPGSTQVIENIAFIWQPPTKPNGVITGYQISISYLSSPVDSVTPPKLINLPADAFVHVLRVGTVPANVTASIKIRASTIAGYGDYSDPIMFEPFATPTVTGAGCTVQEMGLYLGLTALGAFVVAVLLMVFLLLLCWSCKKCFCSSKDSFKTDDYSMSKF